MNDTKPKEKTIMMRWSFDLYDKVRKAAKRKYLTLTAWMREAAQEKLDREEDV